MAGPGAEYIVSADLIAILIGRIDHIAVRIRGDDYVSVFIGRVDKLSVFIHSKGVVLFRHLPLRRRLGNLHGIFLSALLRNLGFLDHALIRGN